MSVTERAPVPVTVTGFRVWDLYAARESVPEALTRGVLIAIDRAGLVVPESDRQVTASELDMILDVFGEGSLSFHVITQADEGRLPELLGKLLARYPALRGATVQINNQLRPTTCEALLPVKAKFALRVVLQHHALYGADAWAPSVRLADQVIFDAGGNRALQALDLNERTVDALRLVAEATKAPISLAGRLTAESVTELGLRLAEVRALLRRPFGLSGEAALRTDGSLDLAKTSRFHEASAKALGLGGPAAAPGTATA